MFRKTTLAITAIVALFPALGFGQERGAYVARFGELRMFFDGDFSSADDRLSDAGRSSIAEDYSLELTAETFLPLSTLQTRYGNFLEAVGVVGDPALLSAGDLSADVASSARSLPLGMAIGLIPRVEIGFQIPIYREERVATGLRLTGGELGLNENDASVRSLLSQLDPSGDLLGGLPLLPTASSPAGTLLRQLVLDATGQELPLPEDPVTGFALFQSFPSEPFQYTVTDWAPGDAEITGRLLLISTFGSTPYPDGSGFRVAGTGAYRFPTGIRPDSAIALGLGPEVGVSGWRAGGVADFFAGSRLWLTLEGEYGWTDAVDRDVPAPPLLFPVQIGATFIPLTQGEQTILRVSATPRLRLTPAISIGATAAHQIFDEATISSAVFEAVVPRRTATAFGGVIRYSSLEAFDADEAVLPIEASAGYSAVVLGENGAPAVGRAHFSISLYPRLW